MAQTNKESVKSESLDDFVPVLALSNNILISDDDYYLFEESVNRFIANTVEKILYLIEKNELELAKFKLEYTEDIIDKYNDSIKTDILLESEDQSELELKKSILSETRDLFKSIVQTLYFENLSKKLDLSFLHVYKNELPDSKTPFIQKKKIVWNGTPAQFAFIIDLLINKGYIEKPTQFAERNAGIFLEIFDFAEHKPSKDSLGKLLHIKTDPISNPEHRAKFTKIPHRNELDK